MKKVKKLVLKKETVSLLESKELDRLKGGMSNNCSYGYCPPVLPEPNTGGTGGGTGGGGGTEYHYCYGSC